MTQEHDYKAAIVRMRVTLEEINSVIARHAENQTNNKGCYDEWSQKQEKYLSYLSDAKTIIHALKLADKVKGAPSEGMREAAFEYGDKAGIFNETVEGKFKAMINQAQKEIEG